MTAQLANTPAFSRPLSEGVSYVERFLIVMTLISGISPLSGFTSSFEHFPYGLFLLIINIRNFRYIFFIAILIIFYGFSNFYYGSDFSLRNFSYLIQAINFLSPIFFMRSYIKYIYRYSVYVFWMYISVGILQSLGLLVFLEEFARLFISRFSGSALQGYRGVSMLETEPARASFQLLMLYVLADGHKKKVSIARLSALVFSQFFIINSATGIIITSLYIITNELLRNFKFSIFLILASASISPFLIDRITNHEKTRIFSESLTHGEYRELLDELAATSGGRVQASIETASKIIEWPMGYGAEPNFVAGEKQEVGESTVKGYILKESPRPVSAILCFSYVFGIPLIGLLFFFVGQSSGRFFSLQASGIVLIGTLYSPPGSEVLLMALMSKLLPNDMGGARR